jgi:hypothetical protein
MYTYAYIQRCSCCENDCFELILGFDPTTSAFAFTDRPRGQVKGNASHWDASGFAGRDLARARVCSSGHEEGLGPLRFLQIR